MSSVNRILNLFRRNQIDEELKEEGKILTELGQVRQFEM